MSRLLRNLHVDLLIDRPAETGCYGFALHIGRLALSVTWRSDA